MNLSVQTDSVKVSVLCFVYNHEKYLRQCLDGFVNQVTNFKFEVIVHDDASTDSSPEIIREYSKKYPDLFIPIFQQENQYSKKISLDYQFMLPLAKGEYYAICEGDDFWTDRYKLQKQVELLDSDKSLSATIHNVIVVDENGKPQEERYQQLYRENKDTIHDLGFLKEYCKVGHTSSFFFRSSIFMEMNPEARNAYFAIDANGDMRWSAIFLLNGKVYHLAEDMSCYRHVIQGGDSWSAQNHGKNITMLTCQQLERIRDYARTYYHRDIDYSGYYRKMAYKAMMYLAKNPNIKNLKIFHEVRKISRYSFTDCLKDIGTVGKRKLKKLQEMDIWWKRE